jgi:4-hydroxythreonine-4-phosphate dehydrogenase
MEPAPLALSLGDPAGIGPEIILKAWQELRQSGPAFFVLGDAACLETSSGAGGPTITRISSPHEADAVFGGALPVLHTPLPEVAVPGRPSPSATPCIIHWITLGAQMAARGEAGALVTGPIAKASLYAAGFRFPGHTEFLADLIPPEDPVARGPVMMIAGKELKVALVTIHEPLAAVSGLLTQAAIVKAGMVTARALTADFGIARPRLAVAGLNPHAGENGALGREEIEIIAPAVAALVKRGVHASGPHAPDSLFHADARTRYDAVLCMYHDQALIPAKMLDFWGGVNVTLGLPIVRTSPDHGTAFDIAGKGVARPDSLVAALRLGSAMAARRAA